MEIVKVLSYCMVTALFLPISGCGPELVPKENRVSTDKLIDRDTVGLPQEIYDVIFKLKQPGAAEEKNQMMRSVKNALDRMPKEHASRDNALEKAVLKHGGDQQQADIIKLLADKLDPILVTQVSSRLPANVYDVIAQSSLPVDRRNLLIEGVQLAMMNTIQAERDSAIKVAVYKLGGDENLAKSISQQVNKAAPLAEVTKESALSGAEIAEAVLKGLTVLLQIAETIGKLVAH